MFTPDKSGTAPYYHYASVEKQTKIIPKELAEYYSMSFPLGFSSYWADFQELNSRRQYCEIGPLPFAYSEIKAWAELSGVTLSNFHLDVLCRLDKTWMLTHSELNKSKGS